MYAEVRFLCQNHGLCTLISRLLSKSENRNLEGLLRMGRSAYDAILVCWLDRELEQKKGLQTNIFQINKLIWKANLTEATSFKTVRAV